MNNLIQLQRLARCNNISIFKVRKDRKGYTRTLLTIPQLKSRLTRHGISYKMKMKINKFGMMIPDGEVPPVASMEEMKKGRDRKTRIYYMKKMLEINEDYLENEAEAEGVRIYNIVFNDPRYIRSRSTDDRRMSANHSSNIAKKNVYERYYDNFRDFYMNDARQINRGLRTNLEIDDETRDELDEVFALYLPEKAAREALKKDRERQTWREAYLSVF